MLVASMRFSNRAAEQCVVIRPDCAPAAGLRTKRRRRAVVDQMCASNRAPECFENPSTWCNWAQRNNVIHSTTAERSRLWP